MDDHTLMAHILRRAKLLAPDRVPQPSREATDAWVDAFLRYHAFPPQLWAEAVDWWAANRANERMLNPQSLREAVYAVRDRWESDPQRREVLQRSRQQRLGSRVDRGELPGGASPGLPSPGVVDGDLVRKLRESVEKRKTF